MTDEQVNRSREDFDAHYIGVKVDEIVVIQYASGRRVVGTYIGCRMSSHGVPWALQIRTNDDELLMVPLANVNWYRPRKEGELF